MVAYSEGFVCAASLLTLAPKKSHWGATFVAAKKSGHDLTLFLAGDGVHILNCKNSGEIVGEGTGDLYEHLLSLKEANTTIFVSGMSAKARGYDEKLLQGYNAEFAVPDRLVEESLKADSVLCY